jgi:hypothetical protein
VSFVVVVSKLCDFRPSFFCFCWHEKHTTLRLHGGVAHMRWAAIGANQCNHPRFGLDWLRAGEKLLTDHPGTHEDAMARFEATWERVDRKGIAKLGRGHAPSHEEAVAKFEAAWKEVMDGTE